MADHPPSPPPPPHDHQCFLFPCIISSVCFFLAGLDGLYWVHLLNPLRQQWSSISSVDQILHWPRRVPPWCPQLREQCCVKMTSLFTWRTRLYNRQSCIQFAMKKQGVNPYNVQQIQNAGLLKAPNKCNWITSFLKGQKGASHHMIHWQLFTSAKLSLISGVTSKWDPRVKRLYVASYVTPSPLGHQSRENRFQSRVKPMLSLQAYLIYLHFKSSHRKAPRQEMIEVLHPRRCEGNFSDKFPRLSGWVQKGNAILYVVSVSPAWVQCHLHGPHHRWCLLPRKSPGSHWCKYQTNIHHLRW